MRRPLSPPSSAARARITGMGPRGETDAMVAHTPVPESAGSRLSSYPATCALGQLMLACFGCLSRTPRVPLKVPVVRHVYLSDWSGPVPVLLYQAAVRASSTEGERHIDIRAFTKTSDARHRSTVPVAGGGWAGFAGGGLLRVGREERSAPGLRPLSRPRIRSSRGRAGRRVRRWVGMVVRFGCPCVPCLSRPVCVPAPPVLPRCLFTGTR
jgi:hypothetical protein